MALPVLAAATLAQVVLASIKGLVSIFGVEMGADGININWRRLLFWSVLAPLIPLIGGRIVAVFRDCVTMFRIWAGEGTTFPMALNAPSGLIRSFLPAVSADPSSPGNIIPYVFYHLFYMFGIDKFIGVTLQLLAYRIFKRNSDRFFSAITAVIHTAVQSLHK